MVFCDCFGEVAGTRRKRRVRLVRAVENCYGSTTAPRDSYPTARFSWPRKTEAEKREDFRRSLPPEVRASVRNPVDASRGATIDDLILRSPTAIPLDARAQAAAHIRALSADWRWVAWFGNISQDGKRGLVADPFALAYAVEKRLCRHVPTHMSLNPLTGNAGLTKEGKASFDCADTVAALRFCLVEFDEMPLRDQLALWVSVVCTMRDEIPVVSIVYSGSKSLHGVVLCPPASREDLARDTVCDADKSRWLDTWDRLIRRFASSETPAERMDLAPTKNPAIHTRVAGAVRSETGKYQKLLYLDAKLAEENCVVF